jgi:hypothetical protein
MKALTFRRGGMGEGWGREGPQTHKEKVRCYRTYSDWCIRI